MSTSYSSQKTMTERVDSMGTVKSLMSSKSRVLDMVRAACKAVAGSAWKNERAKNNNAYVPTMKEHAANIVTHGVLVVPSIWLSYLMVSSATGTHTTPTPAQVWTLSLFQERPSCTAAWCTAPSSRGSSPCPQSSTRWPPSRVAGRNKQRLVSTSLYPPLPSPMVMSRPWRDLLHRSDRAMIYLFIAGSYTPWLQLRHLDGVSVELR